MPATTLDPAPVPGAAGALTRDERWWSLAAVVVVATLVVTRVAGMSRSLWLDEAFTANRYVRDPSLILDLDAYFANNHVLFTALAAASTRVFGTDEAVLRLWAVGPGVAAALVATWWLWRRWSPAVAVTSLAVVTLSWVATQLHTEARGYGLVVAAGTVALLVPAAADRDRVALGQDVAVAGAGLVGMLTFPPFVALYLVHTGTWFLRRRVHRLRLVVLTAAAGAATLAVLWPLLPALLAGADRVGSNRGDPIGWSSPVVGPLRLIVGRSLEALLPGGAQLPAMRLPPGAPLSTVATAVAVVLGAAGLIFAWRERRELALHLSVGLAGSIVLLGFAGFHLLDRYVSFLLTHASIVVAAGLVAVVSLAVPRPAWRAPVTLALLAAAAVGALPHVWAQSTEPRQNFADAAERIEATAPATLVARELHVAWAWYLDRDAIERPDDGAAATAAFCDGPRPAVYLPNPEREPDDGPACLDEAERRTVPERSDVGETVWFVLE